MKREDLSPEFFRDVIEQLKGLTPEEFEHVTKAIAAWPNNQFASKEEMKDFVEKAKRGPCIACSLKGMVGASRRF